VSFAHYRRGVGIRTSRNSPSSFSPSTSRHGMNFGVGREPKIAVPRRHRRAGERRSRRPSRYLAAECGCRVAAIDLTPAFVEVARILTARCGLADRIEFRQANALALPFRDGTFDHVWSYAVTMNIADKEGLGREVARVLKPGGRFSCNEIAQGPGGAPVFPMPWATDGTSSFLVSPKAMRAALEAGGLSVIEQVDVTATRFGDTGRQPVVELDDFPLRVHNLQSCLVDGRLIAQFILAEKSA